MLSPTSLGRILSAFLAHYFAPYVDYSFTSNMEAQLDAIAGGLMETRAGGDCSLCNAFDHKALRTTASFLL